MHWSKLKQTTEARFADEVRGRVELWMTLYRYRVSMLNLEGRAWITVDGVEILNMHRHLRDGKVHAGCSPKAACSVVNVFDTWDLFRAMKAMLTLSIDDALASDNALIRGLAVLDRRVGRRRLRQLRDQPQPPLVTRLLDERVPTPANASHSNEAESL